MPDNKDAYSRYRIIDRELRHWKLLSSKQLADHCSAELGKPISVRTVQKDIQDMKEDTALTLNAPIRYDTRKRRYYYERDTPPLFSGISLSEEETYALLFYTKAASHFKNYQIFGQMSKAIGRILEATHISEELRAAFLNEEILETESLLPSQGVDMLQELVGAVRERRVISFQYKRFVDGIEKTRRLKPLLIKEYKGLWYVIGMLESRPNPVTFAVDRMTNLIITDENFEKIDFNSEEHFRHAFGITAAEGSPIDVILSFTREQGNYVKINPIHQSQQILEDSPAELRVRLKLKLSVELNQKILSYGDGVTVLGPDQLVKSIRESLMNALAKY